MAASTLPAKTNAPANQGEEVADFELVEARTSTPLGDSTIQTRYSASLTSPEVVANLLRNKGQIRTTPDVVECAGQVLWNGTISTLSAICELTFSFVWFYRGQATRSY